MPDQARPIEPSSALSNLPAGTVIPSRLSSVVKPSFPAYSARVSAPSSTAMAPKAQLQELARACSMVWLPCEPVQLSSAPPTTLCPSHQNVRSKRSGMFSIAAARVTSLKTEPGTKLALRHLFIYVPSAGEAEGFAGSSAGVETMQSISPVV